MDDVIGLLRERVVLCGQILKLFTELVGLLEKNSSETVGLVRKIEAIQKELSKNADRSHDFLLRVNAKSLGDFLDVQENGIKRDVAGRLLSQAEKLQRQLKAKTETAARLTAMGTKFVSFTLNAMTQTQTGNTYGSNADTPGQAKKHIFDANI